MITRTEAEEIERLKRQLEEVKAVRDSNRELATFAVEEARLWKRRAKFHETMAGALRIGYNQYARYMLENYAHINREVLAEIHEDYHPGEAPLFNRWEE